MSRQVGSDLLGVMRGAQKVVCECLNLQGKQAKHLWRTSSLSSIGDSVKTLRSTDTASGNSSKNIDDYIKEGLERASMITHGFKAFLNISVTSQYDDGKKGEFAGNDYLIYDNIVYKPDDIEKLLEESYPHIEATDIRITSSTPLPLSTSHVVSQKPIAAVTESSAMEEEMTIDNKRGSERVSIARTVERSEKPPVAVPSGTTVNIAGSSTETETCGESAPLPLIQDKPVLKTVKFTQKLNEAARERKVPSTRLSRVLSFGSLAAGLGLGTVAEMTRRTLGITPLDSVSVGSTLDSAFLTPANAERIVNTLCKVRGAALKIGQLLSIQDNNVISPVLQQAFERVRQSADFMPQYQIRGVLEKELGANWEKNFREFDMKPFAAASIGQVHRAALKSNGQLVAVKIQYPGVAEGINSDIDNLVSVLNLWNIFPQGMFIDNVVQVAKRELSWEVDYEREAECTKKFKMLLEPYPQYYVPQVIDELSTKQVFVTELIDGVPVDKASEFDVRTRRHVCKLIMDLCIKEIFLFRYMQTDPNWSNFFYNQRTNKLILLDFGSSRAYDKEFIDEYIKVIKAAADGDRQKVLDLSKHMKFLTGFESKTMEEAHVDTVMILGEIFNESAGEFDFGRQDTTARVTRLVPTILNHRLCPPPEEIYSLHRKLSGVFLLCSKLNVKMACRPLFIDIYNKYPFN